ncbi:MAG: hypothetical protein ACREBW_01005, partial [Candidatus Micrarchaeaceae archaeon]
MIAVLCPSPSHVVAASDQPAFFQIEMMLPLLGSYRGSRPKLASLSALGQVLCVVVGGAHLVGFG